MLLEYGDDEEEYAQAEGDVGQGVPNTVCWSASSFPTPGGGVPDRAPKQ
jgi:hypothetical protein